MRTVLASVLLGLTVSCAWQPAPPPASAAANPAPPLPAGPTPLVAAPPPSVTPPPAAAMPPAPTPMAAATPAAPARPVVAAAAPASPVAYVTTPGAGPVDYRPIPLLWLPWLNPTRPGGRLTLNNFSFDSARVQAVFTTRPDCQAVPGAAVADFVMPLNATRVLAPPAGADVCWRRELPSEGASGAVPQWTTWNRAYVGGGRYVDSGL